MAATAPGGWEDIKRESSEGDEDSGSELGLHSGLSKSELRKHNNRQSARRSYQRRRNRSQLLEEENRQLRAELANLRVYAGYGRQLLAKTEQQASGRARSSTPPPQPAAKKAKSLVAKKATPEKAAKRRRPTTVQGAPVGPTKPTRSVTMNVPIGSAGPAFTSTRATKRASPAVTPPEDGGAALPAADDKTTAEPTQAFPWSHVKEGPDFPDVGLWHVPKWMAEQQERLAAQQKLATQRLVEQQIKQQEALTKQLMGHLAAPLSAPTGVKTETLTGEDQLDADLNMFERHLNAEDLQFDEADLGWNETEFFSLGESVFN